MKLIDAHTHLQFPQFEADRTEALARCQAAEIGVINVGTDLATSAAALKLAEENPSMWATIGLHPTDLDQGFDEAGFLKLAQHPKCVAIGECGLDFFHIKDKVEQAKQAELFVKQIRLANQVNKPLMLHIRNAPDARSGQAYDEALEILTAEPPARRGNVHFFNGTWAIAQRFLDLGFTLSFPGVITFARDYDETVKNAPAELILAETDAPFAAPEPYRGRRNEPSYVIEVVKRLAALRGTSFDQMAALTLANTRRVFALS
jgi:TatD DNase family protein